MLMKSSLAPIVATFFLTQALLQAATPPEIQVARPGGKLAKSLPIQLVEVATGFVDPIHVASPRDGSGRLFVCERPGRIRIIKDGKVLPEPFFENTANTLFQFLEQGLYCLEFHPNFKQNGLFYVSYADMWFNGSTFIIQYKVSADDPDKADMTSAKPIMRIDFPYANHHGGKMAFGPDGYLYVGVGDGGWEGDVLENGQNLGTWLGKMLRIKVNEDGGYSVPKDNPFVKAAELKQMTLFGVSEMDFSKIKQHAKPEIWAYGLRNPWTFGFDRKTGDLFIADVGQNTWEEVNFQPASSKGGENYGWSLTCGVHSFPIEKDRQITGIDITWPVAEFKDGQDGDCVVGIGICHGAQYSDLDGTYLVGDWISGRIWGLARSGGNNNWSMQELLHTQLQLTCGGEDEKGDLYVANATSQYGAWKDPFTNPPGSVWRVVAADKVPAGAKTAPLR
jgi:glucose/arabinose dehydrogenase